MADEELVAKLKQGVDAWNAWRPRKPPPQLDGANLSGANLFGAILNRANLRGAILTEATLSQANLAMANLSSANLSRAFLTGACLEEVNLSGADLRGAWLSDADLDGANLSGADLRGANLEKSYLSEADLSGADLTGATLSRTIFTGLDLAHVIGLEACNHMGPSVIDHRTLQQSPHLPKQFLRGVGLPDELIDSLPNLFDQAIQYCSCFISYSAKDEEFARQIYADLQKRGVRCWFAPHDMPIGGKILDEISEAIRLRDKVVLVLSEHSIKSDWVEDEVTRAYAEERKRGRIVLFPIRLDDVIMETNEAWAEKLRDGRHIGDFRRWRDHKAYSENFDVVMSNLKVSTKDKKIFKF